MNNNSNRFLSYLLIIIVSFFVIVVSIYFILSLKQKEVKNPEIATLDNVYKDDKNGMQIHYLHNWNLEKESVEISMKLKHKTEECSLSYGQTNFEKASSLYEKGGRFDSINKIFYEKEERDIFIDSSHFKLTEFHQRPQSQGLTSIVGLYIKDFPNKESNNSLFLYNEGRALTAQCISDYFKLLENNIDFSENLYNLNSQSNGTLELMDSYIFNYAGSVGQWRETEKVLVFKDNVGSEKVLAHLKMSRNQYVQVQLVGNKLYFIYSNGQIASFDIFSKKVEVANLPDVIPVLENSYSNIVDFLIFGDTIYYLSGLDCSGGNYCNPDLHQYSSSLRKHDVLVRKTGFQRILGYNNLSKKLYLYRSWGDDGCFSETFNEYDYNKGEMKVAAQQGGCENDPKNLIEEEKIRIIKEGLSGQLDRLGKIIIRDGQIVRDQTDFIEGYYDGIRYIK